MQEPIGLSGVQTVPNSLQSVGFLAPRKIEGHSQLLASRDGFVSMRKRRSASKAA